MQKSIFWIDKTTIEYYYIDTVVITSGYFQKGATIMFIGQVTSQNQFQSNFFTKQQKTTAKLQQSINQRKIQNNKDTFTKSSTIQSIETYKGVNRLTSLTKEPIPYTKVDPSMDLTKDLYSLSKKDYTEKDALVYQYYKKNCYQSWDVSSENYLVTDKNTEQEIQDYTKKIIEVGMNQFSREELKKTISDEELEQFRQELVENGVDTDIDWWEVRSDSNFSTMGTHAASLEQDIDYLCSRYAVLKNQIQAQTGEQKEKNMQILNDLYQHSKEKLTSDFSKEVGEFFENLGASGVSEDIKSSLNAMIEQKMAEYEDYIAKNSNYASLTNEKDTWLYQDSAFMAAQLRNSVSAAKGITQQTDSTKRYESSGNHLDFSQRLQYHLEKDMTGSVEVSQNAVYSLKDLQFAKIYADTMSSYTKEYQGNYFGSDDVALGKEFAQQFENINKMMDNNGIHQNLKQAVQKTTKTFVNQVLDAIDKSIDKNIERSKTDSSYAMVGVRLSHIDRNAVFHAMGYE